MRIRTAQEDDSESISQLICGLSEKFITTEFSHQGRDYLLSTMTPESIRKYMQSGYRYHVAEMNDRLVGVVAVRDNSHLYHLFVAEQYHRQGIAKKLWRSAMAVCLEEGNAGEFTVNSSGYAVGIYQQLGFVAQSGPEMNGEVVYFPMKLTLGIDP